MTVLKRSIFHIPESPAAKETTRGHAIHTSSDVQSNSLPPPFGANAGLIPRLAPRAGVRVLQLYTDREPLGNVNRGF